MKRISGLHKNNVTRLMNLLVPSPNFIASVISSVPMVLKVSSLGTSLEIQWLRPHASNAGS